MPGHGEKPLQVVIVSGLGAQDVYQGRQTGCFSAVDFLARSGTLQLDCVAPFPTVTPTCVASLVTGLDPASHGILGRAWLQREFGTIKRFDPQEAARRGLEPPEGAGVVTVNVPRACGGTGAGVGRSDAEVVELAAREIRRGGWKRMVKVLREHDALRHSGHGDRWKALAQADEALGFLLEAYGSWEEAIARANWVVVGDHGLTELYDDAPVHLADLGVITEFGPKVLIIPNGRTAFVYKPAGIDSRRIAERAGRLGGVDQVFWREGNKVFGLRAGSLLSWKRGSAYQDGYGRRWELAGDPEVVDLRIGDREVVDGEYPDPLYRVSALLAAANGPDVVITARRGYDFDGLAPGGAETRPHRCGANHGSLSSSDSLVPLIAVGVLPPERPLASDVGSLAKREALV